MKAMILAIILIAQFAAVMAQQSACFDDCAGTEEPVNCDQLIGFITGGCASDCLTSDLHFIYEGLKCQDKVNRNRTEPTITNKFPLPASHSFLRTPSIPHIMESTAIRMGLG
jgi:hypothetical protein